MGFFDDIVHTFTSPVEHLIGKTATNILFPVVPISHIAAKLGDVALGKVGSLVTGHVGPVPMTTRHPFNPAQINVPQPQLPYMYQPAPTYYSGGGSGLSYPEAQPYLGSSSYGGSPWDSSTPSTPFFSQPSATYSVAAPAQRGQVPWEDLIGAALPFFL